MVYTFKIIKLLSNNAGQNKMFMGQKMNEEKYFTHTVQ